MEIPKVFKNVDLPAMLGPVIKHILLPDIKTKLFAIGLSIKG